jgi:hypothetical protein
VFILLFLQDTSSRVCGGGLYVGVGRASALCESGSRNDKLTFKDIVQPKNRGGSKGVAVPIDSPRLRTQSPMISRYT